LGAVVLGETAVCGTNRNDKDSTNNPADTSEWGPNRKLRAEFIRWLCVDRQASLHVDPRGIQIYGGIVTGKLDLSFATVAFPIRFLRCQLIEDAELTCLKTPELDFGGSYVKALKADGVVVAGDLSFDDGFVSEGGVRLLGGQIGGNLEGIGGTFKNAGGVALYCDRLKITGSAFLRCTARGRVRLIGAQVGGVLDCSDGEFTVTDPAAAAPAPAVAPAANQPPMPGEIGVLNADRIKVGGVFLTPLSATGEVRLLGAEIARDLACTGSTLTNPTGDALSCDNAKVGGKVFLNEGFTAQGRVRLPGAEVGGDVKCSGGTFGALNLKTAVIKGTFCWSNVGDPAGTELDVSSASIGSLEDAEASWPDHPHLRLDGFSYTRISEGPIDSAARLRWLSRAHHFTLQPYKQLAKFLHELGDVDGSRRVLFEMENLRRRRAGWNLLRRLWNWILKCTIGYGQRPEWALWWILALTIAGGAIFGMGYLGGAMVPSDKDAAHSFELGEGVPYYYSRFNPLIYSIENAFPPLSLGVKDKWKPSSAGPAKTPALRVPLFQRIRDLEWQSHHPFRITCPGLLRTWLCFQIATGWVLATLFVAGFTGIVKTA
jgi:hypothetical protein